MQCETGEYRYKTLTISVHSSDLNSAVLVRFETDDDPRPFGILEILPYDGTFDPGNRDYPYRYDNEPRSGTCDEHRSLSNLDRR